MPRKPCGTCPWRRTTPPGGFPGGRVDVRRLADMRDGQRLQVMQCHATPDGDGARACVGFARQIPDAVGLRLAAAMGVFDYDEIDRQDPPLLTLAELAVKHGTIHPTECDTPCAGCTERCASYPRR